MAEYKTPLGNRYASKEMLELFGMCERASTWRQLWVWLAEAEKELGVDISDEALQQMRDKMMVSEEKLAVIAEIEKKTRHDVMASVHAYGEDAPAAAGIIHYGATSCYVTDNADLIFMARGIDLLLPKLAKVIDNLRRLALQYKDTPALGYTHLQPAQLVTVGKRAVGWIQELVMDLENMEHVREQLLFRGAQGTTGTQSTFLEIFKGDDTKCKKLNEILCRKAGFPGCYPVSTQTYSRKVDLQVANAVCGLGATADGICGDLRLLASFKEMEEPFEQDQVGSSAMPYKRNPMLSERVCSLGRALDSLPASFAKTFSSQRMERTLDDSAIRRKDIPEMFLLADSVLRTMDRVTDGLVVYQARIRRRIMDELPFMASEMIILKMVECGASRQVAHEELRVLSHQASDVVKIQGGDNDFMDRLRRSDFFAPIHDQLDSLLDPNLFVGRSVRIVEEYCPMVEGKLAKYREHIAGAKPVQLSI